MNLTKYLIKIESKIYRLFGIKHELQTIMFSKPNNLIHFGSVYGGWFLIDDYSLNRKTLVSGGLGEDVTFEIECINKYKMRVIGIDPTPRATEYYNQLIKLNTPSTLNYVEGGKQPFEVYDLLKINVNNFIYINKALWSNICDKLKFYSPPQKEHVSYSIVNFQGFFELNSPYIEVETINIAEVCRLYNIYEEFILKIDIEGAECQVLNNMLDSNIFPVQICVEYDILQVPSRKSFCMVNSTHKKLVKFGYQCVWRHSECNFLYIMSKN